MAYADWCDGEPFGDKAEMDASDIAMTIISAIDKGKRLIKVNGSVPRLYIWDIEECYVSMAQPLFRLQFTGR